ncbi:MAG: PSD1 and planctomycete cytochrome C domain-containing protein [Verrucomicrobiaceae bacterium]|nr:PSD1 and planctomycete cytochrome C domain-containing protein [Verrucomicrobiaceae bacterium]
MTGISHIIPLFFVPLAALCAGDSSVVRYNRDVLPILADQCFQCHGFDKANRKAGLHLDQREGAMAELESGARAIVPGDVKASALVERIFTSDADEVMPPKKSGKTLTVAQKDVLKRWIEQGAKYEPHWAYVSPVKVEPPVVAGVTQPVDRFIRARLAKEGIAPAAEADRATLIRRVTLDLTGLPPAPLEVDAFVNDARADAFERVVDRLLKSEHFGERWARWWLDLAHYADSDGYLQDFIRPVAWRWRQWVVDAFNRDMPFDQFTIEQLAGDLLPGATVSQRMGTGFLRNTLSNREGGADLEEYRVNQVLDRTATLGTTWLALTTGCAQCHDHKFDAISQREFYQLYAFFNNADEVNFDAPLPGEREPREAAQAEHDRKRAELIAPLAAQMAELQADWEKRLLHAEAHPDEDFTWDRALELLGLQWGQSLGEGQLEGINIIKTPLAQRTQDQKDRLLDYFLKAAPAAYAEKWKTLKLAELKSKLDALAKELPPVTRAPGMMSFSHQRTTHLFERGDFRRKGAEVNPGTPGALPPLFSSPTDSGRPRIGEEKIIRGRPESVGKPDRLTLARWLVTSEHPLTARVVVNRLWQEMFGRGIVATSENFGVRGDRPAHPELLDWLAVDFMRGGWSIKSTLRQIVLSETYRQSSKARPELAEGDPLNVLVARQQRLRLSAEAVRDASLAASGLLTRTIGGPSVKPPQPAAVSKDGYKNDWTTSNGADRYRRGLYTWLQRTSPFAQSVTFDLPDLSRSCTRRERSNTPLQSLNLLNDPAFLEAAQALASRVRRECHGDDAKRLHHAFQLTLSRPPREEEQKRLLGYLQQQRAIFSSDPKSAADLLQDQSASSDAAWIALASVLLNLDEFITRE